MKAIWFIAAMVSLGPTFKKCHCRPQARNNGRALATNIFPTSAWASSPCWRFAMPRLAKLGRDQAALPRRCRLGNSVDRDGAMTSSPSTLLLGIIAGAADSSDFFSAIFLKHSLPELLPRCTMIPTPEKTRQCSSSIVLAINAPCPAALLRTTGIFLPPTLESSRCRDKRRTPKPRAKRANKDGVLRHRVPRLVMHYGSDSASTHSRPRRSIAEQ